MDKRKLDLSDILAISGPLPLFDLILRMDGDFQDALTAIGSAERSGLVRFQSGTKLNVKEVLDELARSDLQGDAAFKKLYALLGDGEPTVELSKQGLAAANSAPQSIVALIS